MKRTSLVICLAAILLFAFAVPAFAGSPDGTSGVVYGQAVLAPYAITISGGGTDPGSPLTYEGRLMTGVPEQFGSQVTVQNIGTQVSEIRIDQNEAPTAGPDAWTFATHAENENSCGWVFFNPENEQDEAYVLSPSAMGYGIENELHPGLVAGDSATYDSMFFFPITSNSTVDHYMSATISAVAPIN